VSPSLDTLKLSGHLVASAALEVCNKRQCKARGAFSDKTFTQADEELLASVAKDVSVAIENGRMLRQAQERRLGLYGLKVVNTQLDCLRQITYNLRDSLKCEHAKV
jgi:GAF domain-containing protein